jgi:hypothetical protein
MAISDHHEWVNDAATKLMLRGDILWQAMCAEWTAHMDAQEAVAISQSIEDAMLNIALHSTPTTAAQTPVATATRAAATISPVQHRQAQTNATPLLPLLDSIPAIPRNRFSGQSGPPLGRSRWVPGVD